jgi:predicted NBD/HSP70 family sugar kinase
MNSLQQHLSEFRKIVGDRINEIKAGGCSVPGIVLPDSGILHNYVMMPYIHDLDMRAILTPFYPGKDIFVEHNIKSMSSYFLAQRDLIIRYPRILYISVRSGVASGIICNGQLVTSHGEFGHMRVSDANDPCVCGRKGCLDVYFSYRSIVEAAAPLMNHGQFLPDIMHVVDEYDRNPAIRKLLDSRFKYFARAVHDAVNVIDPDLVLISGKSLAAFSDPVKRLREEIRKEYTPAGFVDTIENTAIQFHDLGPEISAQGICYYLIKQDWDYMEDVSLDN